MRVSLTRDTRLYVFVSTVLASCSLFALVLDERLDTFDEMILFVVFEPSIWGFPLIQLHEFRSLFLLLLLQSQSHAKRRKVAMFLTM